MKIESVIRRLYVYCSTVIRGVIFVACTTLRMTISIIDGICLQYCSCHIKGWTNIIFIDSMIQSEHSVVLYNFQNIEMSLCVIIECAVLVATMCSSCEGRYSVFPHTDIRCDIFSYFCHMSW